MEHIHKLNIDNFLLIFEEDVKYIYGGITEIVLKKDDKNIY